MRINAIALALALFLSLHLSHAAGQADVLADISSSTSTPLDINAASAEQLAQALPGIGPAKALRIVQWRVQNGLFDNIEQLQEVKGIGPKTLEKLRPLVRVGTEAEARKTRLQHDLGEEAVQVKIHRVIDGATLAAQPQAVSQVPARPWFQRSVLDIMRTH